MTNKCILGLIVMAFIAAGTGSSTLFASGSDLATSAISSMAGKDPGMMDKLNVNTASIESLSAIPGLSPKIGEAIAAYRDAEGAFKSLSELVNVEGIDAGLLEKIKPFLSI